jgi:hypothetical protein
MIDRLFAAAMKNASTKQEDRLSELPDGPLIRILSLASLGARTLVQTSLFSRRWRHLWHEVRRLDIDPREFHEAAAAATTNNKRGGKRDAVKEWDRFERFAEGLLTHRCADVPLEALRLHVADPPQGRGRRSQPDGGRWVRRCLERCSPPEVDIRGFSGALVHARCLGRGVDLGRLTTLRLRGVVLRRGHLEIGASVCPRLEHLELEDCDMGFTEVVASGTLKTLVVSHTSEAFYNSRDEFRTPRPRIEAPGLASLRLTLDYLYAQILLAYDVPSLVEASVRLVNRGVIDNELDLLRSLYNVTKLELFGFFPLEQVRTLILLNLVHTGISYVRHKPRSVFLTSEFFIYFS